MDAGLTAEVVVAFSEAGSDCEELASHMSLEFMKLDLQCHLMPLRALTETREDRNLLSEDEHYDIACGLTRLGKVRALSSGEIRLSILVFILDNRGHAGDLDEIAATLNEWAEDHRIGSKLLSGLGYAFVACCNAGEERIGSQVSLATGVIKDAMQQLGARALLDELFCFGAMDVGQMVTFTNMVMEAYDDAGAVAPLEEWETTTCCRKRNGSQQKDGQAANSSTAVVQSPKCAAEGTSRAEVNGTQPGSGAYVGVGKQGTTEGSENEAAAVTPLEYTSASDFESGDEAVNAAECGTEEDLENLGTKKSMVSETQRKALTKQGYRLVGDHSAIKLCRWTKSRVRGHGGCYKHTFYGIKSNQCMEMTPSLACANKCVFCWRHHTNPVATEWQWPVDDADFVTEEAVKAHLKLIKELRGILDARSERFEEALQVRHCALSLVGEPIMYPQINELLHELHLRKISTFLVTNAQFPKQMESLRQVTQLYVSIDAADKTSLKAIDRPLFKDYWARFKRCIQLLKNRKERTIFRLTLVKQFNISEQRNEISDYAQLIQLGEPDFVEIKSVTFCGTVHDNAITMQNVPWHDEVIKFSEALVQATEFTRENYDIACEHRHSCCVLVAKKRFRLDGRWHTWIDYDKFHQLAIKGGTFDGLEYSALTPEWALFGSKEEGFDPVDTRVYTKGRKKLPGPPNKA